MYITPHTRMLIPESAVDSQLLSHAAQNLLPAVTITKGKEPPRHVKNAVLVRCDWQEGRIWRGGTASLDTDLPYPPDWTGFVDTTIPQRVDVAWDIRLKPNGALMLLAYPDQDPEHPLSGAHIEPPLNSMCWDSDWHICVTEDED